MHDLRSVFKQFGIPYPEDEKKKKAAKKKTPSPYIPWQPAQLIDKWHDWAFRHREDDPWDMATSMASAPDIPVAMVEALLSTGEPSILVALAGNPSIQVGYLETLAASTDTEVAEAALRNPAAPPHLLENASRSHPSVQVREAAKEILEILESLETLRLEGLGSLSLQEEETD